MKGITIEEIGEYAAFLVAVIGSVLTLGKYLKRGLKNLLKDEFEPINKELKDLGNKITNNTLNQDKNFLTRCFDDLDKGIELNQTTKERIYECMEEYTELGGNSYIHGRFENLKKAGKL